jgi:membrane fusion protein (multidrug efflux system)
MGIHRMPASFPKTLRALERDSFRSAAWPIAISVVVIALWAGWFFGSEVAVIESSSVARIEVVAEPRPVESEVTGRITSVQLVLGQRVKEGDVLVEIDAASLELELAAQRARVQAIEPELAAITPEVASEEQAIATGGGAARTAAAAARQRLAEAEASLALARDELARVEKLLNTGAVPGVEAVRARSEVERQSAIVEAARLDAGKLDLDERTQSSDRTVRIERLRREQARLTGELEVGRAQISQLEHEIAKRVLRAPTAGRLAAVTPLVVGGMVRSGDVVASVLPESGLRIVAHFTPSSALGRLRVGQRAWMRLDGFAWTQYGALPARVSAVAGETEHGKVRVELDLLPDAPRAIPQQHGLPGTVEVEVEHVAPATLVLRALGQFLGRSAPEQR